MQGSFGQLQCEGPLVDRRVPSVEHTGTDVEDDAVCAVDLPLGVLPAQAVAVVVLQQGQVPRGNWCIGDSQLAAGLR